MEALGLSSTPVTQFYSRRVIYFAFFWLWGLLANQLLILAARGFSLFEHLTSGLCRVNQIAEHTILQNGAVPFPLSEH
jgi:hypothetical protein